MLSQEPVIVMILAKLCFTLDVMAVCLRIKHAKLETNASIGIIPALQLQKILTDSVLFETYWNHTTRFNMDLNSL